MKQFFFAVLAFAILFTGCRRVFGKKVRGSGKITSETRAVSNFSSVDVSSSIEVYLRQDSVASVKVETDDNLIPHVITTEEGGVLRIDMQKNYNLRPTDAIKVYVAGPQIRRLEASGACELYSQGQFTSNEGMVVRLTGSSEAELQLKAPSVKVSISGAGDLSLKGETRDLELNGTGSSTLKCSEMMAERVDLNITGAGSAEVFASVQLDVRVTGSGSVKYRGNAAVSQKITGAGSVTKMN